MYRKIKVLLSVALVALVLAGAGLIFSAWADYTFAAGITLTGDADGLKLESEEGPLFAEENMAPGDEAATEVTVKNEGKKKFSLTVSAKKTGDNDGDDLLFEALQVKITGPGGDPVYYSGSMSEMNVTNAVKIGAIPAGGEKKLAFTVLFPREEGNECQGASLNMSWIFNATGDSQGGGGGGGGGTYEPEPPGVSPEEEELEIKPEPPAVKPDMPRTGEGVPYLYYLLGGLALLVGTQLVRKPKRR